MISNYNPEGQPEHATIFGNAKTDKLYNELEHKIPEKLINLSFIRKVYVTLMVQLLITAGFIMLFDFYQDLSKTFIQKPIFFIGTFVAPTVIHFTLQCCEKYGRMPTSLNFMFLWIIAIVQGIVLGTSSNATTVDGVLLAIGITTVVGLPVALFAVHNKWDFTGHGSILFTAFILFTLYGYVTVFPPTCTFPVLHNACAALGAVLASLRLVYETRLMMGRKLKYPDSMEYVLRTRHLYIKIAEIFVLLIVVFMTAKILILQNNRIGMDRNLTNIF